LPVAVAFEVFANQQTFALPELALAHTGNGLGCTQAQLRGDDLRRAVRADERAGVDRIEGPGCEQPCRRQRLRFTREVERDVAGTLDATGEVPIGLAMAHKGEKSHPS